MSKGSPEEATAPTFQGSVQLESGARLSLHMSNPDVPTFSFRIQQQTIQFVVQLHRGARCDDELQPLLSNTQRLLLLN